MARPLTPIDKAFVDRNLQLNVANADIGNRTVATIDVLDGDHLTSHKVSARELCQLRPAQPLSTDFMTKVWTLFDKRESRILMAHKEINDGKQHYSAYRRSFFLPVAFMHSVQADPESNAIIQDFFPPGFSFTRAHHRFYCLDKVTVDGDDFCLVIIDFLQKGFLFLQSIKEYDSYRNTPTVKATEAMNALNRFLDHHMEATIKTGPWTVTSINFPTVRYPVQENDFDSGVYAFIFVYYSVLECPIIIHPDDINRFRKQLAYWMLQEYLPM